LNFGYCIVFSARGRFAPKAKPKPPPPQKNVSAISSKDVNNVNVTSSSSTTHKESQLFSPKNDSHNADIDVNNGELLIRIVFIKSYKLLVSFAIP